jgi:hypothetical protein
VWNSGYTYHDFPYKSLKPSHNPHCIERTRATVTAVREKKSKQHHKWLLLGGRRIMLKIYKHCRKSN